MIKVELAREGVELDEVEAKRSLPQFGNRVDHATLFSGEVKSLPASPARLWRMSPFFYSGFVRNVTSSKGDDKRSRVAQAFSTSSAPGFQDYADVFTIDEPTVAQLIRNAEQIVEQQLKNKGAKELQALLDESRPLSAEAVAAAVRRQFHVALLRGPTAEEERRFAAFAEKNIREAGPVAGMKTTLATVLMLPEALYPRARRPRRAIGRSSTACLL